MTIMERFKEIDELLYECTPCGGFGQYETGYWYGSSGSQMDDEGVMVKCTACDGLGKTLLPHNWRTDNAPHGDFTGATDDDR